MLSITMVLLFYQISHGVFPAVNHLSISANQNATVNIEFHAELLLLTVLGHIAVSQEVHH